tara:strand:- start:4347 stop:5252 length:906 start_codon:yes stop_codon:yes gene_type:complete
MDSYEEKWIKYYLGYNDPSCLIRIGPMGSGKTSAIDKFLENYLKISSKNYMLIDIDAIIMNSNEYKKSKDTLGANPTSAQLNKLWYITSKIINAYKIRDNITLKITNKKRNYSVESTGSYFCPNKELLWKNFTNGYRMIIIFPFVTFDELTKRVKRRAILEGRDIDIPSLKTNYINAYNKIFNIISLPVDFYLINNMVGPGEQPTLLAASTFHSKSDATNCIKGTVEINDIKQILDELQVSNEGLDIKKLLNTFFKKIVKYIEPSSLPKITRKYKLSGGVNYKKKYEIYKKKYIHLKKSIN